MKVRAKGTAVLPRLGCDRAPPAAPPFPQDPGHQHPALLPSEAAAVKGPLFPDGREQGLLLVGSAPLSKVPGSVQPQPQSISLTVQGGQGQVFQRHLHAQVRPERSANEPPYTDPVEN